MRKIIITGSEGFIGQALISACKKEIFNIVGLDIAPKGKGAYEYHRVDLRGKEIENVIPKDANTIVHLAGVMISRDTTGKTGSDQCFDINVSSTLNVARAAAKNGVKHFILASTEWVYGESLTIKETREKDVINVMKLQSEYALSKAVCEACLCQMAKMFEKITILRFSIVYGPGKVNGSAVESLFLKIKNNEPIEVGSLKTGRRFIHVNDVVSGIISAICNAPTHLSVYNLSSNSIITLHDIIKTSEKLLRKKADVKETDRKNYNIRNPSNTLAKKELGWKPKINLRDGLKTLM